MTSRVNGIAATLQSPADRGGEGRAVGLRSDRDGAVLRLTIDRPERRNALDAAVLDGLIEGLERADADGSVRVVVLTGAGEEAFCAGADLAGSFDGVEGALGRYDNLGRMGDLLETIDRLGKPLIGRVNGPALAGGFGLALACDLLVAAEHATFGTPEVRRGLWPYLISTLIADHLGPKRALQLMMTGHRIDAETALAWGLLNEIAPSAELDDTVGRLTDRIIGGSPTALRLGRRSFVTARDMDRRSALAYLHGMLDLNVQTEDLAEGLAAFFEKRDPEWPGR
jgi:enoyl-CoA hydratase